MFAVFETRALLSIVKEEAIDGPGYLWTDLDWLGDLEDLNPRRYRRVVY